jgi:hypothetical protein
VARSVLVIDSAAPLPWRSGGLGIRLVEYSFGHEHYRHFKDFLARGGITGLLAESGCTVSVVRRLLFWRSCREAVLMTGATAS